MNKTSKLILTTLSIIFISACTFLPGIDEEQPYESESCKLITQKLDLDTYMGFNEVNLDSTTNKRNTSSNPSWKNLKHVIHDDIEEAMMAIILAWGASTFIVSGSIIVSGNILHWAEYQGRCEESELRQFSLTL